MTSTPSHLSGIHTCKSCGHQFSGEYCNACGEKVLLPADRSFKTVLNNLLISITFTDNRSIKTLWLIIKNPGFISREFAEGRRVKYLKPISVFFVLNLIYFFFPTIQLFNASFKTQLLSPLGKFYQSIIAHKIVNMGTDLSGFELLFNLKTVSLAKLMVMVFMVIASLPLNVLYAKRNRYFTDHMGYMVELACFNLFINTILLTLISHFLGFGPYLTENVLTAIFIATNLYFLLRSGWTFYGERNAMLVIKSVFMIAVLKVSLELYRSVLFFVTIWSL